MLAEVDEIGEDEFQVLSRGLHNQPGAFDAARLLLVGQECLWGGDDEDSSRKLEALDPQSADWRLGGLRIAINCLDALLILEHSHSD